MPISRDQRVSGPHATTGSSRESQVPKRRWWMVLSPEYGEVVPVTDEGQGPLEYSADVVYVEAPTKREAIMRGVKQMFADGCRYVQEQRSDGRSPYVGIKAECLTCDECDQPDGCWRNQWCAREPVEDESPDA